MSFVPRVAFYPTLLYNVLMEKLSSRQWYNRVDDTIILGALPFKSMTKLLVEEEKVTGVVSLNEDYETRYLVNSSKEWADAGVQHLRLTTPDLVASPTVEQLVQGVDFIMQQKQNSGTVYVHCKAGRTRSATLVACYLMKIHQMDPSDAISHVKKKRPHIIIRHKQLSALDSYYSREVL